jgi:drug/metabolite transporter (DMT)-like permease
VFKPFYKIHKDLQGICFLMLAYMCFASLNIIGKTLYAANIDPFIITFYRSFFCVLLTSPFVAFMLYRGYKLRLAKINLYKGIVDFLSLPTWVMAVSYMNIPEAVGLTYLTPIITAILAIIFLKDRLTFEKWTVMAVGLTGAYIILKPDFNNFNYYSIYALTTCILWAVGNIMTKNLANNQHPIPIVFLTNIVIMFCALPFFATHPYWPKPNELALCLLFSIFAASGYLFLSYAYRCTNISNLLPYDYFRLIFATILAYIFLGQLIDGSTIIGSALIFVSSTYLVRKQITKAKVGKEATT